MYLLDTNTVIYFLDNQLPATAMHFLKNVVDDQSIISVITKMEALGYNFKSKEEQVIMETFIINSVPIFITDSIINTTINIRKYHKIKLPDAIIAATAIVNNFILISRNASDFLNIEGLNFLDLNTL